MFFYVAKVGWFLAQPSSALLILLLLGTILIWTSWARTGRRMVAAAAVLLLVAGLSPLGNIVALPLEQRFAAADLADGRAPDGIIVLGGAQDTRVGLARGVTALTEAGERITEALALSRRFPEAKIAFSGGAATILYPGRKEAVGAKALLTRMGLDPSRLILEDRARDTFENARLTKALVKPRAGERWLLVTSAYHMPRSIGCFRAIGWDVEPWPVDYRTRGPQDRWRFFDKPSQGLRRVDMAAREWAGLLVYWLTGRTQKLFPSPGER
ncbi:MAG: YdcF family protein [Hyphomicrobiales bacterium]|nr:YdcF family protein [Hyphomicrobiales bacterium]